MVTPPLFFYKLSIGKKICSISNTLGDTKKIVKCFVKIKLFDCSVSLQVWKFEYFEIMSKTFLLHIACTFYYKYLPLQDKCYECDYIQETFIVNEKKN